MRSSLRFTIADLYLAYRQAKTALYFERRGVGLQEIAQFEKDLPNQLRELKKKIDRQNWFDDLPTGESWVVPKRFRESIEPDGGIIRIGTQRHSDVGRPIDIQVRVSPDPAFAIMEVLYLWQFGGHLDGLLAPEVVGYRLELRNQKLSPERRWLFQYWQRRYQEFRTAPLAAARTALARDQQVTVISADLASFYDTVDPAFLLDDEFVADLRRGGGDEVLPDEYRTATESLLGAYARFRDEATRRTGASVNIGVPIGALTSRLVANLALEPLDRRIAAMSGVLCYRRYVDDIVIVALDSGEAQALEDTLKAYFPFKQSVAGVMRLDCDALSRPGSDFQLQTRKVRIHHLAGDPGADFVEAVAADFSSLVSERRAFLDNATLHGDGASHLVRARQPTGSPLRVLRDADRARLERYALSTSLRSLERVSSLIDRREAAGLVRDNLARVSRVLEAEGNWLEDLDVSLQLLRLAVMAGDWTSAAELNDRMNSVWGSVESLRTAAPRIYFRGLELNPNRMSAWTWLRNYLHERRVEALASAIPLAVEKWQLEERLLKGLTYRTRWMGVAALKRRAFELAMSDLRSLDREEDTDYGPTLPGQDRAWMRAELADGEQLTARFDLIQQFVDRCESLKDRPWVLPPARLFLCTRPPSYFDIARRWLYRVDTEGFEPQIFHKLLSMVNAVRGTGYAHAVATVIDPSTVSIDSFWSRDKFGPHAEGPRIILGNLVVEDKAWTAAAARTAKAPMGSPLLTFERLKGLATVLDKASRASHGHDSALLVLPELSLPRAWFRALSNYVVRFGRYGMVAGLEYLHDPVRPHVSNQVYAVLPGPFSSVAAWPWTKRLPAHEEASLLRQLPISLTFPPLPKRTHSRTVVRSPWGSLSVLVCSELIEARRVADLLGRADVVICPAWNRDTSSYDHLIRSVGFQLHCIIAISNNGLYSDCRAWAPLKDRPLRDLCRLIERGINDVVHVDLPLASLLDFHGGSATNKEWRPLPPDWP
jgi:hypothetical protein